MKALGIAAGLTAAVAVVTIWWFVYRPLPRVDGKARLAGLQHEVTVDRDAWGVPHIRAMTLEDLGEAQGYVMAQDRLWQMDVLRRVASGELSEIFGARALPLDRRYRTLGLRRAADREAAALEPDSKRVMEAYTRGVNRLIEDSRGRLPLEFSLLGYEPRPWRVSDSLIIAGYMYETLTSTWKQELNRTKVTAMVGVELSQDLFAENSELDRFVVGGSEGAEKTNLHSHKKFDDDSDQPKANEILRTNREQVWPDVSRTLSGAISTSDTSSTIDLDLSSVMWETSQTFLARFSDDLRLGIGSNNWVVSGAHTASGKPMLANDTHLELGVPSIWYIVHLTAPELNVKGFTLPGAPLVIIGHNDRIAWGFTNDGADVQDLYIETFNPAKPRQYRVNGEWREADVREETIRVKGQPDASLDVVETRHGPIVAQEPNGPAYALHWTALQPGGLAHSYSWIGRSQNWEEFRNELKHVWGPAQNTVYADVDGNIGFIVAARIPVRKKGRGDVPSRGETDDYEWTGYIPFEDLPQALNPPNGIIATANARVTGPGYKHYLTDRWASPYRTARIYELLEQNNRLRPADFLKIQTDIESKPDRTLGQYLVQASKTVPPKDSRVKEMIAILDGWDGQARANGPEALFVAYARHIVMLHLLEPYLGQETEAYQWRSIVFLEKVLKMKPARWLPTKFNSYEELLMTSANEAAEQLAKDTKSEGISGWKWGDQNRLQMGHPMGRSGRLRSWLGNVGREQDGTVYSIRAASPTHGPAMRFVADLSDWDNSLMLITTGQSGQFGSAHYRDQFPIWFEGREVQAPFSNAAEEKVLVHRLVLKPAP